MEITESSGDGYFRYQVDDPYNLEQIPKLYGEISVPEEGHYFLWVQAGQARRLLYEWEGQRQDRELSAGKSLFDLRQIPAGKRLQITLPLNNRPEHDMKFADTGEARIYAAKYDDQAYQELYELLSREPWKITRWGDTFLEGEVESLEGEILWTSVPWEKGWQVTINGIFLTDHWQFPKCLPLQGKRIPNLSASIYFLTESTFCGWRRGNTLCGLFGWRIATRHQ